MVRTTSAGARCRTIVTNGGVEVTADTMKGGAGSSDGFGPHELLEAAVAACMNIGARLKADEMGVGPVEVATEVSLDRSGDRAVFRGEVHVHGELTDEQRTALEEAAFRCPVSRTLLRECVLQKKGEEVKAALSTRERHPSDAPA
jgi:putative redox protein